MAFVAALLTATFLLTGSRQDAQPDLPKGAQGMWHAQSSNTDVTLLDVAFADSSRGWAVGVGGTVCTPPTAEPPGSARTVALTLPF